VTTQDIIDLIEAKRRNASDLTHDDSGLTVDELLKAITATIQRTEVGR